jgi:hypothetical protein
MHKPRDHLLMSTLMRLLRYLNPFAPLLNYLRERQLAAERAAELARLQRAEEAEATRLLMLEAIRGMQRIAEQSFAAAERNSAVFQQFLATYDIAEPPKLRQFDVDDDNDRYLRRKTGIAELDGKEKIDQYKALIEKMDRFALDD